MKGATAAIDMLLNWDVRAISATLGRKTSAIAEAAQSIGLIADPIGVRAPHFLALRFPDAMPKNLPDRFAAEKVFLSLRGASLRVTPHLYNDDVDAERLLAVLQRS